MLSLLYVTESKTAKCWLIVKETIETVKQNEMQRPNEFDNRSSSVLFNGPHHNFIQKTADMMTNVLEMRRAKTEIPS